MNGADWGKAETMVAVSAPGYIEVEGRAEAALALIWSRPFFLNNIILECFRV